MEGVDVSIQVIERANLEQWAHERDKDKAWVTGLCDSYNLDRDDEDHYAEMLGTLIELAVVQGPVQMALWMGAAVQMIADYRQEHGLFDVQDVDTPNGGKARFNQDGLTILDADGDPCECGCNERAAEQPTDAQRAHAAITRLLQRGMLTEDQAALFRIGIDSQTAL